MLLEGVAVSKTFEVFSGPGRAPTDFTALFDQARPDAAGALEAVKDADKLPLDAEPSVVADVVAHVRTR
ncbi:hypothetical protein [Streptomyces sp. NPDC048187]|uniref:hypothetical protein n=1 Tax=unclassified Streptomyces TaxID=2593676 RepID=UPI00371C2116